MSMQVRARAADPNDVIPAFALTHFAARIEIGAVQCTNFIISSM
jgi:hypothetical protein